MPNNILSVWPHLVLQLLHELPSFTSTDINCWITSKILTTIRSNASNTERKCWNSASFSVSLQNTRFLDLFFKLLYAYSFACVLSCFSPVCATPWTVAHQASLSVGFSRQEYWSGLSCPPPGDPPNPEIKPGFPAFQANSLQLHHGNSLASEGYTGSMPGPGGFHMPQGS